MKTVRINHPSTARSVATIFYFNYPDGSFEDFEKINVVPVDSGNNQLCKSEIRTVVKVGQPINGVSQYKGSIHINP